MLSPLHLLTSLRRCAVAATLCAAIPGVTYGQAPTRGAVVADAATRAPLPNASIFDRNGKFVGMGRSDGSISGISPGHYPITVRYLGFKDREVSVASPDTIFLQENTMDLPEVTVASQQKRVLHILAYVREYSTLSSYADTVAMFREKMVDFMFTNEKTTRFRGWSIPRVLNSKSYYHFTNWQGLDSVSDRCSHHFSWSDWIGIPHPTPLAAGIAGMEVATDTLKGKYTPAEIWARNGDRVALNVNVLADSTAKRWVPYLNKFFPISDIDFEQFLLRINYSNVTDNTLMPRDITGYSFNIDSRGRGMELFRFAHWSMPFFVSTYTEVYILDKEYITIKEARKWERNKPKDTEIEIFEAPEAPALGPDVVKLMARVDAINHEHRRLGMEIDTRVGVGERPRRNFGQNVMARLRQMFRIDALRGAQKRNQQWNDFRHSQVQINHQARPRD